MKVSVCVVTYNQKDYIRDCLQGLVNQDVDFRYEIIVGDDASTDGTSDIVREFASNYPDLIVPLLHKENLGPTGNYFSVHRMARGEYICHVDGDDLAFPEKLQVQVDALDSDGELNIVWHRMRFFDCRGAERDHPPENEEFVGKYVKKADLLLYGSFGSHSSVMYRRENFSRRYESFDAIDFLLSVELMGDGFGLMLPQVLGGYRIHRAGMSGGAVANARTRELLCKSQEELAKRFPEHSSLIALRCLFVAGLDFLKGRPFFSYSLVAFFKCKAIPALWRIPALVRFYKYSKLPGDFR